MEVASSVAHSVSKAGIPPGKSDASGGIGPRPTVTSTLGFSARCVRFSRWNSSCWMEENCGYSVGLSKRIVLTYCPQGYYRGACRASCVAHYIGHPQDHAPRLIPWYNPPTRISYTCQALSLSVRDRSTGTQFQTGLSKSKRRTGWGGTRVAPGPTAGETTELVGWKNHKLCLVPAWQSWLRRNQTNKKQYSVCPKIQFQKRGLFMKANIFFISNLSWAE